MACPESSCPDPTESPDPFQREPGGSCRIALRLDDADRAVRRARATIDELYTGRLPPDRLSDLLLLVSELVTNAMEHGARGLVTLDVALGAGRITVTVTSPGERSMVGDPTLWRLPTPDRPTGRGLALTARLARSVSVISGEGVDGNPAWIAISAELSR